MKVLLAKDPTDLFQRDVVEALKQLNLPILNGILVKDVALGTTTVRVSHTLNRVFNGYIIVKQNADARVWLDTSTSADPDKFLPLKASATVTVSLWVF